MRLSQFISEHMESILSEWEAFAGTLLPAASGLDPRALRDHARQILEAVAKDLNTTQSRGEQSEKSKGRPPKILGAPETAAQTHAVLRARGGFDINQLVAEYRALRASVLRLWMDYAPLDKTGLEDMIRFNEAIDQAVAESVGHFHRTVEQYRNVLLGMLGHDMRNPLSAIVMTAKTLTKMHAGEQVSEAAKILMRSGESMQALLDDLTDYNRTRLGLGLKIARSEVDLAQCAANELEQFRAAYPLRQFDLTLSGNTRGRFDSARVQQLLRNLISNAVKHGSANAPVRVKVSGNEGKGAGRGEGEVVLEVSNSGHIDSSELRQMFDPVRRSALREARDHGKEGLGLGLFIVQEIAKAHGGEVDARCEREQTIFSVRLPRKED